MLTIGNVTVSSVTEKGFKKVTQGKIISNSLSNQLNKMNESNKNTSKTNEKPKKKQTGKVFASGNMSKTKLQSLKQKLKHKLSELMTGVDGEDDKFKDLRMARLKNQIEAIDRMLNGIRQAEVEKEIEEKQKKKSKESIWIEKKDLKSKEPSEKQENSSVSVGGIEGITASVMEMAGSIPITDIIVEGDVGSNVDISL